MFYSEDEGEGEDEGDATRFIQGSSIPAGTAGLTTGTTRVTRALSIPRVWMAGVVSGTVAYFAGGTLVW